MTERTRGRAAAAAIFLTLFLAVFPGPGAGQDRRAVQVGLAFDAITRTLSGDNSPNQPKLKASLFTAQAQIGLRPGLRLTLLAGFSLSNLNGMVFRDLPISLNNQSGALSGLSAGAGLSADLAKTGDFVIQGDASFVYSMGFTKTVPIEGFAVEGSVKEKPSWFMVSAGPRIAYTFFGKFVPYLAVTGSWISGNFRMDEALSDLTGTQKKSIRVKSYVELALGGDFAVTPRFTLKGRAGFLPFPGGVDAAFMLGVRYTF